MDLLMSLGRLLDHVLPASTGAAILIIVGCAAVVVMLADDLLRRISKRYSAWP